MISDSVVLAGLEQKVLLSLPTEDEKKKIPTSVEPLSISKCLEKITLEPISCLPELLALDPDLVQEELKKQRKTRARII